MTYIYETLSTNQIAHAFYQDDYASWHQNMAACDAIAEYLEELAESTGEPLELDIVAFRCDFSHYKDMAELNKEYGTDFEDEEELAEHAQVIHIDGEQFITDYCG
ncbi:MAG: hypothetical protein GWO20_00850 [Candidatus Korarchaeota archaeon]|nr:hypothetical protein [Candidatus Korarchaeota archaeon]